MADLLLRFTVGLGAGVLSGMFGIGGGLVTTPAIRMLLGAPALIAVGTPLPVIIPTAITGAVSYASRRLANVRVGVTIGATGAVTAIAGAWASRLAGGAAVMLATAAVIIVAAADMLHQSLSGSLASTVIDESGLSVERNPAEESSRSSEGTAWRHPRTVGTVALGIIAGLYSGFLGLGGGFVIVPVLTRFFEMPVKRAIGTSLVAVAIMAVPGTAAHALLGHIDWGMAAVLTVGSIPGAIAGAALTVAARERHIRIAFAVLLIATAIALGGTELAGVIR